MAIDWKKELKNREKDRKRKAKEEKRRNRVKLILFMKHGILVRRRKKNWIEDSENLFMYPKHRLLIPSPGLVWELFDDWLFDQPPWLIGLLFAIILTACITGLIFALSVILGLNSFTDSRWASFNEHQLEPVINKTINGFNYTCYPTQSIQELPDRIIIAREANSPPVLEIL